MTFLTPDAGSTAIFVFIVAAVLAMGLAAVYWGSRHLGANAQRRTLIAALSLAGWMTATSGFVGSGILAIHPVPWMLVFFVTINLAAVALALSPVGGWIAHGVALRALVGFQSFRLPLELVLHDWVQQGSIPGTMTWTGQNFDILSGAAALAVATTSGNSRSAARVFNIVGFALLLNVARVAIMSAPVPFGWGVTPPLQLAAYLPYAWTAIVCIPGALAGHIILSRALLQRPAS